MRKLKLKAVSLVLTIVMLACMCPLGAWADTASQTVIQDDISKVAGLENLLQTSANISYGYEPLSTKGQVLSYHMSYTSGDSQDVALPIRGDHAAKITNGILSENHGDFSGFYWFDNNNNWKEGYLDFTFSFPATASITNFLLVGATDVADVSQRDRRVWEYKVYASNTLEDLYSDSNEKAHYDAGTSTASEGQYITFGEAINAQYFGVRILKGCNPNSIADNRGMSCARLREIAIIGSIDLPDEHQAINQGLIKECKDQLDTSYNLLSTDYVAGTNGAPGTISAGGSSSVDFNTAKAVLLVNHDTNTHVDMGAPKFFNDSGYIDGTYLTISFALTHEADIEKFFISLATTSDFNLRAYEYEVYTSMDYATLYSAENMKWKYTNVNGLQNQVHVFSEAVRARFVGVKITKGVMPNCTYPAASWVRISEIALFGEYDLPVYNYTVSSGEANLISESGSNYYGSEISLSAPLTKNGYSLRGWTLNGKELEHTVNILDNISTTSFTLEAESEVVAVYTPDDTEFSGNKYRISKDGTKVSVTQGEILYNLLYGFEQYPINISAKNKDGVALAENEHLRDGYSLNLNSNGQLKKTLTVVTESDYTMNGEVDVTDIVGIIDTAFGKECDDEVMFRIDANGSGTVTVSDVVKARNTVLYNADGETTYTSVTTPLSMVSYKQQGRNVVNTDGSLRIEWTASGLSFNADCYGDVVINIQQNIQALQYYTVVVDGQESFVSVEGSSAQNITLAKGLTSGRHSIGFYKQGEGGTNTVIKSITVKGRLLEADSNKPLIEFIGDSITCGALNLVPNGMENSTPHTSDGYMAYGTQTARMLGFDWSNISISGSSMYDNRDRDPNSAHMPTIYSYADRYLTMPWDFNSNRKADIVVVNLGSNDNGVLDGHGITDKVGVFTETAYSFAKEIIALNGDDVQIVFAFGMMNVPGTTHFADTAFDRVIERLASEDNFHNAYHVNLPSDRSGGYYHPQVSGDTAAAEVLSKYIRENVIK